MAVALSEIMDRKKDLKKSGPVPLSELTAAEESRDRIHSFLEGDESLASAISQKLIMIMPSDIDPYGIRDSDLGPLYEDTISNYEDIIINSIGLSKQTGLAEKGDWGTARFIFDNHDAVMQENFGETGITPQKAREYLTRQFDSANKKRTVPEKPWYKDYLWSKDDFKTVAQAIIQKSPYKDETEPGYLDALKWLTTYTVSLGGRIGPKGLRGELLEAAKEYKGFGEAVGVGTGDALETYFSWKVLYPKLFEAVGIGGEAVKKLPAAKHASKLLERIPWIDDFVTIHPKVAALTKRLVGAFVKGEIVGQTTAAAELAGKDEPIGSWVSKMNKRGAMIGGISLAFSAAHSYDQYRYIKNTKRYLYNTAYQRHLARMKDGMSEKSSRTIAEREGDKIQDIIYYMETEFYGESTQLYGGKKPALSPEQAAKNFARHGYDIRYGGKTYKQLKEIKRSKLRDVLLHPEPKAKAVQVKEAPKAYQEIIETATGKRVGIAPPGTTSKQLKSGYKLSEPIPFSKPGGIHITEEDISEERKAQLKRLRIREKKVEIQEEQAAEMDAEAIEHLRRIAREGRKAPEAAITPEEEDFWARVSDKALDEAYHYGLSEPGTFGFEANKKSAARALEQIRKGETDIDTIAAAVHEGWAETAQTYEDPVYKTKPEKRQARMELAETKYEDLAEEEKEKDRVVARAILEEYQKTPPTEAIIEPEAAIEAKQPWEMVTKPPQAEAIYGMEGFEQRQEVRKQMKEYFKSKKEEIFVQLPESQQNELNKTWSKKRIIWGEGTKTKKFVIEDALTNQDIDIIIEKRFAPSDSTKLLETEGELLEENVYLRIDKGYGKSQKIRLGKAEQEYAKRLKIESENWVQEALEKAPAEIEKLKEEIIAREAGMTDEQLSGISKKRRRSLVKETAKKIKQHDIYQSEIAALEQQGREIGPGFYYVHESGRGEVEGIIGKFKKGKFKTKLQNMFTFDRNDLIKYGGSAVAWDVAVQEGLTTETEEQAHMDLSEFVQRVKDSVEGEKEFAGLNRQALEAFERSGYPDAEMLAEKFRMLQRGASDIEINEMITEWAERNDIPIDAVMDEFVNAEKMQQIAEMSEEEREAELERLATEQILAEDQIAAQQAAIDVLEANKIEAEVRKVEEIEEEEIPFERRGRPTGAAMTLGQREVILLALGADIETGAHEGWHLLRNRLTNEDLATLMDNYGPGIKGEESEAAAFGRFYKQNKAPSSAIRKIFEKIRRILAKIRSALAGKGLRTVEDIFGEALAGRIQKTEPSIQKGVRFEKNIVINDDLELLLIEARKYKTSEEFIQNYVNSFNKAFMPKGYSFRRARQSPKYKKGKAAWEKFREDNGFQKGEFVTDNLDAIDLFWKGSMQAPAAPERGIKYETSGQRLRREAEQRARINARKARLKAQQEILPTKRRKKRAPALKRIKIKVREELTPALTPDLAAEIGKRAKLPGAEELPVTTKAMIKPVFDEKWFEANMRRERKSIMDSASSQARRSFVSLEKMFSSMSTRLNNIAPKIFQATRKYMYDVMMRTVSLSEDVTPMVKAIRKMEKSDRRRMDLALKNGIDWKIEELVEKYGIREQYEKARSALDEIYNAAKEVGIEIEYMKDYWPRMLKDPEGFLMYFQGRDDWSIIEQAIKRRAEQAGRKIEDLTVDEKAHVVNTLLRGYRTQGLTLARPGPAKERTVEAVSAEIDTFYEDSMTSVFKYIKLMNAKIAEREFFGRETKQIQNLRKTQSARLTRLIKLKRRVGLKAAPEAKYKEHISKTAEAWKAGQERLQRLKARPLADTIGGYVMRLQASGLIQPSQEKQVQNILSAIFDPTGMGSKTALFASGIYIDTLNSPLQALTQLDEFAYSVYRSPLHSIPALITTIARKSKITPRDIGITSIGEEFKGPSMQLALSLMLKSTGFEQIDRLNKENYINTVFRKYRSQARKASPGDVFYKRMERVFGDEYHDVVNDLQKGEITDNVKYLLFNELLDIQPVAITEMPESFAKAGNWRLVYSLKSFYIKRLDFIRKECFKDMKSKDTFAHGFGKLVWISFAFATLGAGSDFLKDLIRGKKFDLKDSIADSLLRMVFFSKYQAWRTREKGFGTAVLEGWRPPTKAIDALSRDIINEAMGKDRGWELWRSVPVVGEEYYWWFGGGAEKRERTTRTARKIID